MKYRFIQLLIVALFLNFNAHSQEINLKEGLIAFYPFEGSDKDNSGKGKHLNNYGAKLTNDRYGQKNRAYQFNRNMMEVELKMPRQALSLAFWVKKSEASNSGHIIGWGNKHSGFMIATKNRTNSIWVGKYEAEILTKTQMQANRWYHFAITVGKDSIADFYIDGKLDQSAKVNLANFNKLTIGKSLANDKFQGKIDDIYIYDRKLSFLEIKSLMYNEFDYEPSPVDLILPYADVDKNIPVTRAVSNNTYALIIGNENYKSEKNVAYAKRDAFFFNEYLTKTLGIPKENIELKLNAMYAEMQQSIENLSRYAKANPNASLIFYYAGHGLPDETTRTPYMLPIDASGTNLKYAVNINKTYATLTEHKCKGTTIFLDACFSGSLDSLRGVKVRPKNQVIGDLIVFSSSSGTQPSTHYKSKKHGTFTYFLLKKMQESKGNTSFEEMFNYLKKEVGTTVNSEWRRDQTPNIIVSGKFKVNDNWKNKTLK